jgi:hypothetical protein
MHTMATNIDFVAVMRWLLNCCFNGSYFVKLFVLDALDLYCRPSCTELPCLIDAQITEGVEYLLEPIL